MRTPAGPRPDASLRTASGATSPRDRPSRLRGRHPSRPGEALTEAQEEERPANAAAHAPPKPPRRTGRRALALTTIATAVVAAAVAAAWWLDQRATHRATLAAAAAEIRADLAARYAAMEGATSAGADSAGSLRVTLQEHLTVSDRSDDQLATDRQNQQALLADAGQRLQRLASDPAPELAGALGADAVADDLDTFAVAQQRASQLGERFATLAAEAERWAAALTHLRAAAERYVATVEGQPQTNDPNRLRAQWEEERTVLADYRAAAEAAAQVPGLEPIGQAYLTYIEHNAAFAEEAIGLLGAGSIDAYNARLREVFGAEDPFGFDAAVATATGPSLEAGVLGDLPAVHADAIQLQRALEAERADVAPTPTPS